MSKRAAFFDVDGTIFRSSLLIELVETLVEQEVFPPEARQSYQKEFVAWVNREGSYEAYIAAVVQSYMEHIKGVFYGDLADVGRAVVAEQSKHVYRYTRDLISSLKASDYYVVAISQSPKTILDEFCAQYGFDKVYGRIYEIGPQDRFTGDMIDIHLIENKANIVSRVIEKEDVTQEGSIAVGDTEGDITLLEAVERPICFNPNQKLFDHAKLRDWEIVVERKDVIYEL
ncbi:MAG: HAD-IB family hydrolase [Patescibacteria group bacterium]